jgi:hypothetical protein
VISYLELLAFCVVGRVILFVLQKASSSYLKFIKSASRRGFLTELFECDLCLGVWVYSIGAVLLNVNVIYEICKIPFVSQIVSGILVSFLVWVLRNGWDTLFKEYHID